MVVKGLNSDRIEIFNELTKGDNDDFIFEYISSGYYNYYNELCNIILANNFIKFIESIQLLLSENNQKKNIVEFQISTNKKISKKIKKLFIENIEDTESINIKKVKYEIIDNNTIYIKFKYEDFIYNDTK